MDDLYLTVVNRLWVEFSAALVELAKRLYWSTEDRFLIKLTFSDLYFEYPSSSVYCVDVTEDTRDGAFEDLPQLFAELVSDAVLLMTIREVFSVTISQLDC